MPRGIGDDRVPHLAGTALGFRAACRGGAGRGEPREELVARPLELGDGGDPRLGASGQARRSALGLTRVDRELRLDPRDLPPQLVPRRALVAGPPRLLELELGGECGEVRLLDRRGLELWELRERGGDGDDHRHVARVEARGARRVDRLAGDPLRLR